MWVKVGRIIWIEIIYYTIICLLSDCQLEYTEESRGRPTNTEKHLLYGWSSASSGSDWHFSESLGFTSLSSCLVPCSSMLFWGPWINWNHCLQWVTWPLITTILPVFWISNIPGRPNISLPANAEPICTSGIVQYHHILVADFHWFWQEHTYNNWKVGIIDTISMSLANGGHHGDFGNCTATDSWQGPARVNISCGNLSLAGIHCVLTVLDY